MLLKASSSSLQSCKIVAGKGFQGKYPKKNKSGTGFGMGGKYRKGRNVALFA